MNINYELDDNVDPAFKYTGGYGTYDAVYTSGISLLDSDNPFIAALPAMLDSKQILNHYYKPCGLKPNTDLSKEEQVLQVSALSEIRIPLPFVETLERQFFLSLVESYRRRQEFGSISSFDITAEDKNATQSIYFRTPMGGDTGNGFSLLGVGGCGKTEAVNNMLSRYPQVIQHNWEFGSFKQIVWLYVITPANSNLSDLYVSIGRAIDAALRNNEPFYENMVRKNKSVGMKAMCVSNLFNRLHVGALILDEIQNVANDHVREGSLDSIVQLVNTTKISLNIIGTEAAFYGLFYKYYINRRAGTIILANEYCRNMDYWKTMVKLITKVNWFLPGDFVLSDEIIDELYDKTHGIIDRVVVLWSNIQKSYIFSDPKPFISPDFIERVNEEKNPLMGEFTRMALESCPIKVDEDIKNKETADNLYNARAAKANAVLFANLRDIEHPIDAMNIYRNVKEHLTIEGRVYNDTAIVDAVAGVMKQKAAQSYSEIEIISKVIKRLKRKPSDKRYKQG